MARGRGRPLKKWSLNAVDHIAEYLDSEFKSDLVRISITADSAERVAERMLNIAAKRDPKYNNYSGNLQRSYMVMARSGNMRNYYVVNPGLVPSPKVTQRKNRRFNRVRVAGTKSELRGFGRGKAQYFRLTLKRHSNGLRALKQITREGNKDYNTRTHTSPQRDRFVRQIKEAEQKYRGAGYMHQYTHLDKRVNDPSYDVASRNADAHFVLANLTPYAGCVEKKGYRVLDYGKQNKYRKIVQEEVGKRMAVGVKWICDQMNRDSSGRFTSKIKSRRK